MADETKATTTSGEEAERLLRSLPDEGISQAEEDALVAAVLAGRATRETTGLGDRRLYMGASDAAAILGLDNWRTPTAVWMEKRAPEPLIDEDNEDKLRGRLSEPVMRGLLAHQGVKPGPDIPELRLGSDPIIVHPDFYSAEEALHELKAPRQWGEEWGEEFSDQVPTRFLVQLHVQVAVARTHGYGKASTHEINAICGQFRRYRVEYDHKLGQSLLDRMRQWWDRHVVKGIRPDPINRNDLVGYPASGETRRLHPEATRLLACREALGALSKLCDGMRRATEADLVKMLTMDGRPLPKVLADEAGRELASVSTMERVGDLDIQLLLEKQPSLAELINECRKPAAKWVQFYSRKTLKEAAELTPIAAVQARLVGTDLKEVASAEVS